jgi:hypothetical protein
LNVMNEVCRVSFQLWDTATAQNRMQMARRPTTCCER